MSNILTIFVDNDTQLSIFKDSEDIWGLKWLKKHFFQNLSVFGEMETF